MEWFEWNDFQWNNTSSFYQYYILHHCWVFCLNVYMLWWQRKNNEKNWIKNPHFRALLIDYCFAPPSPISSCISSQSISCQVCSCPMENTSEQHCSSTYCMELQHTTQANWMYNCQNHVPHCFWLIIVDFSALLNSVWKLSLQWNLQQALASMEAGSDD